MKEILLKYKKQIFYGALILGGLYLINKMRAKRQLELEKAKYHEKPHTDADEAKRLSESQIASISKNIYDAMNGVGTYEVVIYDNLRKLNNNEDYKALLKRFGTKTLSTGYLLSERGTLPALLRAELNSDELEIVNNILASKKIKDRI